MLGIAKKASPMMMAANALVHFTMSPAIFLSTHFDLKELWTLAMSHPRSDFK
jgi:hypothetical protein